MRSESERWASMRAKPAPEVVPPVPMMTDEEACRQLHRELRRARGEREPFTLSEGWAKVLTIPLMLGWFAWASVRYLLTPFVLMAVGLRGLISGRIGRAFSEGPTLTDEIGGVVIAVILIVLSQAFF